MDNSLGFEWYDRVESERLNRGIQQPVEEAFEPVSDTVFRSSHHLVTVSRKQLQIIFEAANASPLRRARLCCHRGPEEKLQEMFIVLAKGVEIEESVHLRKDESLTVIEGRGTYIFPNEDGSTKDLALLANFDIDDEDSGNFFARINRYVPHKIVVDSEFLLIHEATSGPFLKNDTDYRLKRADQ